MCPMDRFWGSAGTDEKGPPSTSYRPPIGARRPMNRLDTCPNGAGRQAPVQPEVRSEKPGRNFSVTENVRQFTQHEPDDRQRLKGRPGELKDGHDERTLSPKRQDLSLHDPSRDGRKRLRPMAPKCRRQLLGAEISSMVGGRVQQGRIVRRIVHGCCHDEVLPMASEMRPMVQRPLSPGQTPKAWTAPPRWNYAGRRNRGC